MKRINKFHFVFILYFFPLLCTFQEACSQDKEKQSGQGYVVTTNSWSTDNAFKVNWFLPGPVEINSEGKNPAEISQIEVFNRDYYRNLLITLKKPVPGIKTESNYKWEEVDNSSSVINFPIFGEIMIAR
jgi:hypothetical protein